MACPLFHATAHQCSRTHACSWSLPPGHQAREHLHRLGWINEARRLWSGHQISMVSRGMCRQRPVTWLRNSTILLALATRLPMQIFGLSESVCSTFCFNAIPSFSLLRRTSSLPTIVETDNLSSISSPACLKILSRFCLFAMALDPNKRDLTVLRQAVIRALSFTTDDETLDDFCTEDRDVVRASANREPLRTPSVQSPHLDGDSFPWAKALHTSSPRALSVIPRQLRRRHSSNLTRRRSSESPGSLAMQRPLPLRRSLTLLTARCDLLLSSLLLVPTLLDQIRSLSPILCQHAHLAQSLRCRASLARRRRLWPRAGVTCSRRMRKRRNESKPSWRQDVSTTPALGAKTARSSFLFPQGVLTESKSRSHHPMLVAAEHLGLCSSSQATSLMKNTPVDWRARDTPPIFSNEGFQWTSGLPWVTSGRNKNESEARPPMTKKRSLTSGSRKRTNQHYYIRTIGIDVTAVTPNIDLLILTTIGVNKR